MIDKVLLAFQLAKIVITATDEVIEELKGHRDRYDSMAAARGRAAGVAAKKSSDAAEANAKEKP